MTVKELKDLLNNYDESLDVVAYTEGKHCAIDIFVEPIKITYFGIADTYKLDGVPYCQNYYDVGHLPPEDDAVLISIEAPKISDPATSN